MLLPGDEQFNTVSAGLLSGAPMLELHFLKNIIIR